jgi:hypothetical protein
MTDNNFIIIEGGAFLDIKKALRQWIDLYSDSIDKECSLEFYTNGSGKHIVKVDNRIDNERFCYLLNYLKYSENTKYKMKILGYLTVSDLKIFPKIKLGSIIQIFIPDFDQEYDNVYAVTFDNETYKVDFGGKTVKVELINKYQDSEIDLSNLTEPDILKVRKKSIKPGKPNAKTIGKRFNIISIIIFLFFCLSYLLVKQDDYFIIFNFALGFGVTFWLFFDYKILQLNEYYLKALLIGSLIALYGYFLSQNYGGPKKNMIMNSALLPTFFLITQRIYRFIFKTLMKREPIVDKPAPSFADGVYMFVLLMTALIVPALMINK